MTTTLVEVVAALPAERRVAIEDRFRELWAEYAAAGGEDECPMLDENNEMRPLAELKAELLADPAVAAEYAEMIDNPVLAHSCRRPDAVRRADRAWRARQRAADIAPLSDKVVYPRKLVDAPPPPKKGRQGK